MMIGLSLLYYDLLSTLHSLKSTLKGLVVEACQATH